MQEALTTGTVPVDAVLSGAMSAKLDRVIVVGVKGKGKNRAFYAASSSGKTKVNEDLIDEFKRRLEENDF